MEDAKKRKNHFFATIFLAVFALAVALAAFLYWQSGGMPDKNNIVATTDLYEKSISNGEDETGIEMEKYSNGDIVFNYPKEWYTAIKEGFLIFTSWDTSAKPERGLDDLRLVVGKVPTDVTLHEFVGDYLIQNITSDASYDLLGRKGMTLGGVPAVLVQATTSLEEGAAIQSAFAFFEGNIWSVEIVGTVLDTETQDIFDKVIESFKFVNFVPDEIDVVASEEYDLIIE